MAHIFVRRLAPPGDGPSWHRIALEGDVVPLASGDPTKHTPPPGEAVEAPAFLFRVGTQGEQREEWIAIAREELVLNGHPVPARIAALVDRDELRVRGETLYVSYEREARVERYARNDAPLCPRCQTEVEADHLAVTCPGADCGVVYHQDTDAGLPCWLAEASCRLCPQPTPLDAGPAFDPSDL